MRGFARLITDTASLSSVGGTSKIDSIQNVILLRSDIRDAWDGYEIGVNVDDNYRITAFRNGHADLHGLWLDLDHITDPSLRPLDVLLRDHFLQGLLKHIRGAGEKDEDETDFDDAFESGAFDLSDTSKWTSGKGQEMMELALEDRLFEHCVQQSLISV